MNADTYIAVANTIAKSTNVRVVLGGNARTCYETDPPYIIIPILPEENEDTLTRTRGFLYHECSHVRFTEQQFVHTSCKDPILKEVFNILEDVRIEYKMSLLYKGVAQDLKTLSLLVFNQDWFNNLRPAWPVVLLIKARGLPYQVPPNPIFEKYLTPDWYKNLSCAANFKLAQKITKELKQQNSGSGQSQDQSSGSGQDQSSGSGQSQGQNSGSGQDQSQDQSQDQNQSSGSGQDPQDLAADISPMLTDLGDRLASSLRSTLNRYDIMDYDTDIEYRPLLARCRRLGIKNSGPIKSQLKNFLQSQDLVKGHVKKTGNSLNAKKLYRVALDDPYIFNSKIFKNTVKAEVKLLLDLSSSMLGKREEVAYAALHALELALQNNRIDFKAYGYFGTSFFPLPFNKYITPCGLTFTGQALTHLLNQFNLADKTTKKLAVLLTDGETDSSDYSLMKENVKLYREMKINLIGIGIQTPTLESFLPPQQVKTIDKIEDFTQAFLNLMRNTICQMMTVKS